MGGTVRSGQPYIVGEAGAELFTPNQTGTITPNNAMGGNNVNININAVDAQGIDDLLYDKRAMLVSVIQKSLREQGTRLISYDL